MDEIEQRYAKLFANRKGNVAKPLRRGRGNGWVYLAFAETIEHLPENYKGKDKLCKIFKTAVEGLTDKQDDTGLLYPTRGCGKMHRKVRTFSEHLKNPKEFFRLRHLT